MTGEPLPDQVRRSVAGQLAAGLPELVTRASRLAARSMELGETLSYWALWGGQPAPGEPVFAELGLWHLVYVDGAPVAWARSALDGGEPSVEAVGLSGLPAHVVEAAGWLESEGYRGGPPRLAVLPAAYSHVLWLSEAGGDWFLPVEAPDDVGLAERRRYELDELMSVVSAREARVAGHLA
jgi:hypothetical protein